MELRAERGPGAVPATPPASSSPPSAPIPAVRALESDPAGFTPDLLAPRRRARVDLDARARGRRRRLALASTACSTSCWWPRRWAGSSRPGPLVPVNVVAARAGRTPARPEQKAAVLPGLLERRRRWRRGPGPTPIDGRASTGDELVLTGTASPGGGRRPGRAPPGGGPHRRRAHPGARAGRRRRPHGHAARRPRPRAALRRGRASTASACRSSAVVGDGRRRRRRRRAAAADRRRAAVRRDAAAPSTGSSR